MESTSLETIITHLTSILFIVVGVATWLLRWLVGIWSAKLASPA